MSDSKPTVCTTCGSHNVTERVTDYIDVGVGAGIPCESEFTCGNPKCKRPLGYWAYGSFVTHDEHPEGFDLNNLTQGEIRNLLKDMKAQYGIETLGQLKEAKARGNKIQNAQWGTW